jgi:two-component system LytT family sensor kinase
MFMRSTMVEPVSGENDALKTSKVLLWAFGFWTAFAVIEGIQTHIVTEANGHGVPFNLTIRMPLAYCWYWALVTPAIFLAVHHFPIHGDRLRKNLAIHFGLFVTFTLLHGLYRLPLNGLVYPTMVNPGVPKLFLNYVLTNLMDNLFVYGLVAGVAHAIDYFQEFKSKELKAAELQAQLTVANLQALKSQIQPHFLFNTLNTISALMHEDIEAAENMMTDLSDILRRTLENGDVQETTVREEMEALEPYISIQRTRFQDRLSFEMDVVPEAMAALVPTMVVHTLVENSMRHGIGPRAGPGKVRVQIAKSNGSLKIAVKDNGQGLSAPIEEAYEKGIGLKNTRERLRQLYGEEFNLELRNLEESGFGAFVTIPFRTEGSSRKSKEFTVA